jgi:hypothetical protein
VRDLLEPASEAADPKDDVFNLAGLVENEFFDVADLFVGVVINVDTNGGPCGLALLPARGEYQPSVDGLPGTICRAACCSFFKQKRLLRSM